MSYSVIIISLNEEKNITACINSIKQAGRNDVQIILSDGGSNDKTISLAKKENLDIVNSLPGRGVQFNTGFTNANGDIILFLHADTTLPKNAFDLLDNYFRTQKVKAGTFRMAFDKKHYLLSLYSKFTSIDSIFTKFGDQCIVIRRDFFNKLSGFKNWPLFEDVDILRRARKLTKIYSFPAFVTTSSKRFTEHGILRQQILNGWMILRFLSGKQPFQLSESYNDKLNLRHQKSLQYQEAVINGKG